MLLPLDVEPWRLSDDVNALLSADNKMAGPRLPPPPPPPPSAWDSDSWMLSEDAHTLLRAVADTPPMLAPSRGPALEPAVMLETDPLQRSVSIGSWEREGPGLPPLPGHTARLGARLYSA